MYRDPSLIREHVVKLRFNDNENSLIDAFVTYTGQQKAAFFRELLLEAAERALFAGGDHAAAAALHEGASPNRSMA